MGLKWGPRFFHHILYQRATISGMLARDYLHRMDENDRRSRPMVKAGKLLEESIVEGLKICRHFAEPIHRRSSRKVVGEVHEAVLSRFTSHLFGSMCSILVSPCAGRTVHAPFTPASNVHSSAEEMASQNTTAWGKHGMLILVASNICMFHLPMFHAPHHYQVIFHFHLQDAKREQELRQQLRKKAQVWTIDPIEFDLLSLSSSPTGWTFQADVFEGHFERNGIKRYSQQSIVVDEVVVFRELKMG